MTGETQLMIGIILIWLTWSSVFLWEWFWLNSKKTKEASAESEGGGWGMSKYVDIVVRHNVTLDLYIFVEIEDENKVKQWGKWIKDGDYWRLRTPVQWETKEKVEAENTRLKELNREMVIILQGMNNRRKRNEEIYFDSPFFNNAMKLLDKLEAEGEENE